MVSFDVDQEGWGSSKIYDDGTLDGEYDPHYVVIHWGGYTSQMATDDDAFKILRSWQAYHLKKGWQDIAYNYAVTEQGTICRLRGENHGGHTSGIDPATGKSWSTVGVGIVWVGGLKDADGPSPAAKAAMQRIVCELSLPVMGHQDTGKATACPGQDWLDYAHEWNNDSCNDVVIEELMYPLKGDQDNRDKRQFYVESWQLKLAELEGFPFEDGSTAGPIEAAGMARGVFDDSMGLLVGKWGGDDQGIGPKEAFEIDAELSELRSYSAQDANCIKRGESVVIS